MIFSNISQKLKETLLGLTFYKTIKFISFFHHVPRAIFRTDLNIDDGAFLQKYLTNFSRFIVGFRVGSKQLLRANRNWQ